MRWRATRRTGAVAVLASLLLTAVGVGTAWAAFAATLTSPGTFSTGTLIARTNNGTNCTSSSGTVTVGNAENCVGNAGPSGALTTGAVSTGSVTLSSVGNLAPAAATMQRGACGVGFAENREAGNNRAIPVGNVTPSATNGPWGAASRATSFGGTNGYMQTMTGYNTSLAGQQTLTIVGWFKSTTNTSLLGLANQQGVAGITNYDRHLWISNTAGSVGRLVFGVYPGAVRQVVSTSVVNDGNWHFFAATTNTTTLTMSLTVDGDPPVTLAGLPYGAQRYATTSTTTSLGWWHLGYARSTSWGFLPASDYLTGSLAGVGVIAGTALNAAQISNLYTAGSPTTYDSRVLALSPANYWPLDDTGSGVHSGVLGGWTTTADSSGTSNTATLFNNTEFATGGPLTGAGSLRLDGNSGWAQTTNSTTPGNLTVAGWFRATATAGGQIIGFTNLQGAVTPANGDRSIWTDNTGRVYWGTKSTTGTNTQVNTTASYNDGNWHFYAATAGAGGMTLTVDGVTVTNPLATTRAYAGFWHLGWGSPTGAWTNLPANSWFTGSIAQTAVFNKQLTAPEIASLHTSGTAISYAANVATIGGATSYWPLNVPVTDVCSRVRATITNVSPGPVTSCVYPAGAGACPAPSGSTLLSSWTGPTAILPPTNSTSATITVRLQLNAATPAPIALMHLIPGLSWTLTRSGFSATTTYPFGYVTL